MDMQTVDVGELIALYLADQLNDFHRCEFEQRFLADEEILRELECTARFKSGLHALCFEGY